MRQALLASVCAACCPILVLLAWGGAPGEQGTVSAATVAAPERSDEVQAWRDKYEALQADRDALQQQAAALKAENERLQKKLAGLETERDVLAARVAALEQRAAAAAQAAGGAPAPKEGADSSKLALDLADLGAALFEQDRYAVARAVLELARTAGDRSPVVCYRLAFCEEALGDDEAAGKLYAECLAALGAKPDADPALLGKCLNNFGVVLWRQGSAQRAAALWRRAVDADPSFAAPYFNLGLLYASDPEQKAAAIESLRAHVVHGGARGISAWEMIQELQGGRGEAGPQQSPPEGPEGVGRGGT